MFLNLITSGRKLLWSLVDFKCAGGNQFKYVVVIEFRFFPMSISANLTICCSLFRSFLVACQTRLLIGLRDQTQLLWLFKLPLWTLEALPLLSLLGNTVLVGFLFQVLRDGGSHWFTFQSM